MKYTEPFRTAHMLTTLLIPVHIHCPALSSITILITHLPVPVCQYPGPYPAQPVHSHRSHWGRRRAALTELSHRFGLQAWSEGPALHPAYRAHTACSHRETQRLIAPVHSIICKLQLNDNRVVVESTVILTLVVMPRELVKVFQDHQRTRCQTEPEAGTGSLPHPSWLGLKRKLCN